MFPLSRHLDNSHGTLLVVRLLAERAMCVECELIDQTSLVEERHKHVSLWTSGSSIDPCGQFERTTAGLETDLIARIDSKRRRIVLADLRIRRRHRALELRHAGRHCPRVPVLEH